MSDSDETGMTVTPEMGLQVLERAKEAIYAAFEGQGDSPASAVSTAIVGYRNALAKIAALEAELAEARNTNYYQRAAQAKFKLKDSREGEKKVADALGCPRVSSIQTALELRAEVKLLRAVRDAAQAIAETDAHKDHRTIAKTLRDALAATEGKT